MKRCIATVLLLTMTCLATGCAGEGADEQEPRVQRRSAAPPIQALTVAATANQTVLTYGADVVRVYPPDARRPADLADDYVVLDAWPVQVDARGPMKLQCGGPAGEMCQDLCHGTSCTSGPPPPVLSPNATHPNQIALRRAGLELPAGTGVIRIDGLPSILVLAGGPRTSLAEVARPIWAFVKDQPQETILHVYNVVDPAGAHPLHNTVIAIPVRREPTAAAQPIQALAVAATESQTVLSYGADVVRVYPPDARRPADLADDYVVLDAWPVQVNARGPMKLQCGGPVGGMCTSSCQGLSCTSGPPPPVISPNATHPNQIALRRAGLELPAGTGVIRIDGLPSIVVLAGGTRTSLAEVARALWAFVKDQPQETILHVYNVVDPAGAHPLHNTVIAIPVLH